ncbi:D-arabinono-1,4-lactone oxidase [Frondihabitans australicus]|uniref:Xylitol oxidase n=1 Tax=Frondihabitans australicus TaxID=386892 RepID=A0A495ICJ7_9MICO|nr:D-arabinono-1,4-lactone oxidase [Frondihabitans australicus]RKR73360.1 xylitol oxidase [Frondihabitans australicus]
MQGDGAGSTWSGTYTYTARDVVRPTAPEQVAEIVAGARHVRALGTRHSFNDVADGPGTLLDLGALPADLVVDAAEGTATLGAGTRYGVVAPDLDAAGFAFTNMGSLPHISIAGATATGTHGSGTRNRSLSAEVRALEIVDAAGGTRILRRGDPGWGGAGLHLGLLGVVTRVTLDVVPAFRMRQDAYGPLPWSALLEDVSGVFGAGYSVSGFTNWDGRVRELLVKSVVGAGSESLPVPDDLAGAPRLPGAPGDAHHTARDGSAGPWWDRLPHFPIGSVPSVGSEVQSEHFVPLARAVEALDAVAALAVRIQPLLHVTELRTLAGDDLWLSPTQGQDVLCIAFTWKRMPDEVMALLPAIEEALLPFGGRPHWGKLSSLDAATIDALYPRLADFRALVRRSDPDRKFASRLGSRLLAL